MKKASDFQRVRADGCCWSNRQLVLCSCPNHRAHSRYGFSVSRRIGNAVTRNRVKRHMREVVRAYVDLLEPGYDIVVIARKGIRGADWATVEGALVHLFGVSKLFRSAGEAPSE